MILIIKMMDNDGDCNGDQDSKIIVIIIFINFITAPLEFPILPSEVYLPTELHHLYNYFTSYRVSLARKIFIASHKLESPTAWNHQLGDSS